MKKRLICLLLTGALVFLCGCNVKNNDVSNGEYSEEVYFTAESDSFEQDSQWSENYENTENLIRMGIRDAKEFCDGYALIELEDENEIPYYAIINTNGEVRASFEKGQKYFCQSCAGNFYFKEGVDNGIKLFCLDDRGNTVYEKILSGEDSLSYLFAFGSDGTLFLTKKSSGYSDAGSTQYMLVSFDGSILKDWSDVYFEGQKINPGEIIYRSNGLAILVDKDKGTYLLNANKDKVYKLDIAVSDNSVSELMGGYLCISQGFDKYVLSSDGVLTESDFSPFFRLNYSHKASDAFVYCGDDHSLYDASLKNKIAEVDVPKICEEKPDETTKCTYFKSGYAAFVFKGADEREYLTLIDATGEYKIEPILLGDYYFEIKPGYAYYWDGNNIIIINPSECKIYDNAGFLKHEINLYDNNIDPYCFLSEYDSFQDGCLPAELSENQPGTEYPDKDYCYLKSDGSILFPEGAVYVSL